MTSLLYIHWNLNPTIPLPTQFFSIQWYGLMWTLSIIGVYFLWHRIFKQEDVIDEHLVLLIQYVFMGAVIGARLAQILFYDFDYFAAHPSEMIQIWKGGLASHGSVIGSLVAVWLYMRRLPQYSMVWLFDHITMVVFLPCALIRIGNLCNSELYGIQTDMPWAFIFDRIDNIPRHPVVLYETIAYLILLTIAIGLYRRWDRQRPGYPMAFFFTSVFGVRFLIEFFKEPEGALILGLISKTQLLSVPVVLMGLGMFYYFGRRHQSVKLDS
jgi:phosphatidylglycerol---prolipoprotein diacylglyceryl transferase